MNKAEQRMLGFIHSYHTAIINQECLRDLLLFRGDRYRLCLSWKRHNEFYCSEIIYLL